MYKEFMSFSYSIPGQPEKILIKHTSGFFSCCNVKLTEIINYYNIYKKLPSGVDSSQLFGWYKINKHDDITFDYFENYNKINNNFLNCNKNINYHWKYQFSNYCILDYNSILPFIEKYFSPSSEIKTIIKNIEEKYNLDYNNICVLFYRGNDKNTETKICGYDEYIVKAKAILNKNPIIKFLIQSDETEFIEKFTSVFPSNSFYFKDEIRHIKHSNSSVDIVMKQSNYIYSKYYLAITIIMSKCNYIVCGSGNCSIWIIFYRGNNKNIYQNLNNYWIDTTDISIIK